MLDTLDWSQITGKPSTFPPGVHTHSPDDLSGSGTQLMGTDQGQGYGYRVGVVRYDSNGPSHMVVPTGGAATMIFAPAVGGSNPTVFKLFVAGDDGGGGNAFLDELVVTYIGGPIVFAVQSSTTAVGAPRARTYSVTTGLRVALGGAPGVNYSVRIAVISFFP